MRMTLIQVHVVICTCRFYNALHVATLFALQVFAKTTLTLMLIHVTTCTGLA